MACWGGVGRFSCSSSYGTQRSPAATRPLWIPFLFQAQDSGFLASCWTANVREHEGPKRRASLKASAAVSATELEKKASLYCLGVGSQAGVLDNEPSPCSTGRQAGR